MIATVETATILGARGHPVTVEVHIARGLPGFTMLGLPDESCREARDRVRAAVLSSGFSWPEKKVTVNLAPPHYRKTGSGLDVAIAIGVLVASEVVPADAVRMLGFAGELGLDGSIRRVPGVAPMVGVRPDHDWVVPAESVARPRVACRGVIRPVERLDQLVEALTGAARWPEFDESPITIRRTRGSTTSPTSRGSRSHGWRSRSRPRAGITCCSSAHREPARRCSPGGCRACSPTSTDPSRCRPPMVHSAAGVALPPGGLLTRPPFRAPHHTSSLGSVVGGGSYQLRPGEISLAHGGVLFLDEMGQFSPKVLDGLREALEDGQIMVGRVEQLRIAMPARFQLIGATNPCPCGGSGTPSDCACDERSRQRYTQRLSGPLLDRFDLRVAVNRPDVTELLDGEPGESTAEVAARVHAARAAAIARGGGLNAELDEHGLNEFAPLDPAADRCIRTEMERGRLTGRGYHRIRRVARTLADLAGGVDRPIEEGDVAAALGMRARVGLSVVGVAA